MLSVTFYVRLEILQRQEEEVNQYLGIGAFLVCSKIQSCKFYAISKASLWTTSKLL